MPTYPCKHRLYVSVRLDSTRGQARPGYRFGYGRRQQEQAYRSAPGCFSALPRDPRDSGDSRVTRGTSESAILEECLVLSRAPLFPLACPAGGELHAWVAVAGSFRHATAG
jgi:hypothetical protein